MMPTFCMKAEVVKYFHFCCRACFFFCRLAFVYVLTNKKMCGKSLFQLLIEQNEIWSTHLVSDIKEYVKYIEKAVSTKEPRFMSRVARGINSIRHRLNQNILRRLLQGYIQAPSQSGVREDLMAFLDEVCWTHVLQLTTVMVNVT